MGKLLGLQYFRRFHDDLATILSSMLNAYNLDNIIANDPA
jgi:hypothetical protein